MKDQNGSALLTNLFFGLLLLVVFIPIQANAQWEWKDASGQIVFSDQPPPANIPEQSIIKRPTSRDFLTPSTQANNSQNEIAPANTPKTMAEKELEFQKRQQDAAEAQKKQAEAAEKAKKDQAYCSSLRSRLAAMQSAGRLAKTNEQGERVYLDDEQRKTESNNLRQQISEHCK